VGNRNWYCGERFGEVDDIREDAKIMSTREEVLTRIARIQLELAEISIILYHSQITLYFKTCITKITST
jgi:hypothetical protein